MILSACSDPLGSVGRLTDVDVADINVVAAALPEPEETAREGFLGTSAAQGAVPDAVSDVEGAIEPAQASEPVQAGGFLRGLINRAANADPAAAIAADVAKSQSEPVVIETTPTTSAAAAEQEQAKVELAALREPTGQQDEPASKTRRGGLFGGAAKKKDAPRTGPDTRDVPFGTTLAFGEIARVCEARGKSLGTKIDTSGRRGFTLYDSKHGIRDKRTYYVTGFGDNCPRQFTAANALFGTPSFYELIRFSPAGDHLPYAATDKAYDKVKSKLCSAGKNKPCGAKIGKMDDEAAFISAYEYHEHNDKWKEFFVHDGKVLASAVKR
ncbi:MAG: hypothetical protein ABJJ53_02665 [Sulfitobacter sp.]